MATRQTMPTPTLIVENKHPAPDEPRQMMQMLTVDGERPVREETR